jgi:surface polysaccharide O-acyltransferase-like enzyme
VEPAQSRLTTGFFTILMLDIVLIIQKLTNIFSERTLKLVLCIGTIVSLILAYNFSKGYKEDEENSDYFFGGLLAIVGIILIILFSSMVKIS